MLDELAAETDTLLPYPLVITAGEKKTEALVKIGIPAAGLSGVTMGMEVVDPEDKRAPRVLLPSIKGVIGHYVVMTGTPLVVNGWTLFAHPVFLEQLDALIAQVEALRRKDPASYVKENANKRLVAIAKLEFEVIPQDPTRPEYRQGNTLGDEHKH